MDATHNNKKKTLKKGTTKSLVSSERMDNGKLRECSTNAPLELDEGVLT